MFTNQNPIFGTEPYGPKTYGMQCFMDFKVPRQKPEGADDPQSVCIPHSITRCIGQPVQQ